MTIYSENTSGCIIPFELEFSVHSEDFIYDETGIEIPYPILEVKDPQAYFIAARDIYYSRVGTGISDPELSNIDSTFALGASAFDYRIWFRNTAGYTKYLDFTLDYVLVDNINPIRINVSNSEPGYTGFILLRKNSVGNWIIIKDLTIQVHVESIYTGIQQSQEVIDIGTDEYRLWSGAMPSSNNTARIDWDMLWFTPGRCIQSAELNDIQMLWKYYQGELGRTMFADGDIVEGCTLAIDSDNGSVTISDGKMYLDGRVRNISGEKVIETIELEETCTSTMTISGASGAPTSAATSATDVQCFLRPVLVKTSNLVIPSGGDDHTIGIKVLKWVESDDDDSCLTDPASGHLNYGNRGAFAAKINVLWCLDDPEAKTIFELSGRDLSRTINDYGVRMSKFYKMLSARTREESSDYAIVNNGYEVHKYDTNSAEISAAGYDYEDILDSYFDHSRIEHFIFKLNKNFIAMLDGNRVAYLVPNEILVRRGYDYVVINGEQQFGVEGKYLYPVNIETPIQNLTDIVTVFEKTEDTTKGTGGGIDTIPDSLNLVTVNKVSWFDGIDTHVYVSGADYNVIGNTIDWSPSGINPEPTLGETYQVNFTFTETLIRGTRLWKKKVLEVITKTSDPYDTLPDTNIIKVNGIWPLSVFEDNEDLIIDSYYTEGVNYTVDNGQRSNIIQHGTITWDDFTDLEVISAGQQYYISYEYWDHQVEGNYVTVDSYTHRDFIVDYGSNVNANCLDFRTDSSLLPASGAPIFMDYQAFNWRRDLIGINKKSLDIVVIEGDSKLYQNQLRPVQYEKETIFPICTLIIPPYTENVGEVILKNKIVNTQKMEDIHAMTRRLSYVEDYMLLNMLEKETLDREVDGTKKGVFIDPFIDFSKCDWNYKSQSEDPEVKTNWTVDPQDNRCLLPNEIYPVALIVDEKSSTCDFSNKDATIMRSTEFVIQEQLKASNVISLQPYVNPVSAVSVPIKLYPQADNWINTENVESNSITFDSPIEPGKKLTTVWQKWKTSQEGVPKNVTKKSVQYKEKREILAGNYSEFDKIEREITTAENIPIKASMGTKIKDLSTVIKMRQIPIRLSVEGLIPNREYKIEFDETTQNIYAYNVKYIADLGLPVNINTQSYIDAEQSYIDQIPDVFTHGTVDSVANTFMCDDSGKSALTFILPNDSTGFHDVKIVDVETDDEIGKTNFYASGFTQEKASEEMTIGIPSFEIGEPEFIQVRNFPKPNPNIIFKFTKLNHSNLGTGTIEFEEGKWLKNDYNQIKIEFNSPDNEELPGLIGIDLKVVGDFRENIVDVHTDGIIGEKTITPVMKNGGKITATVTIKSRGGIISSSIQLKIKESFVKRLKRQAIARAKAAVRKAALEAAREATRRAALEAARKAALEAARKIKVETARKAALEAARKAALEAVRLAALEKKEAARKAAEEKKKNRKKFKWTRRTLRAYLKARRGRRRRRKKRRSRRRCRHSICRILRRGSRRSRRRRCRGFSWRAHRRDPVSQSFNIFAQYPEGAFLNAVGVYFSSKPTQFVRIAVGKLDERGFPNRELILEAKILEPEEITISDSATEETKFIFDSPIFLEPNSKYFFEVFCEDPGINIWFARIGESDVVTKKVIMHQANSGTMFISPNRTTWKTQGTDDLKFKLYGLEFDTSVTEELVFTDVINNYYGTFDIDFDTTQPYNTNILTYYSVDNQITWRSIQLNEVKELNKEFNSFDLKLMMNTKNKFLSPIIRQSSSALRFISFDLTGRYISKTIEVTEPFNTVKLVYQNLFNSKTSVVPYISVDNGITWMEIIANKDPYELETLNNFEYEFEKEFSGQSYNSCKIKLEMASSNNAFTPQIRKLRALLYVK